MKSFTLIGAIKIITNQGGICYTIEKRGDTRHSFVPNEKDVPDLNNSVEWGNCSSSTRLTEVQNERDVPDLENFEADDFVGKKDLSKGEEAGSFFEKVIFSDSL